MALGRLTYYCIHFWDSLLSLILVLVLFYSLDNWQLIGTKWDFILKAEWNNWRWALMRVRRNCWTFSRGWTNKNVPIVCVSRSWFLLKKETTKIRVDFNRLGGLFSHSLEGSGSAPHRVSRRMWRIAEDFRIARRRQTMELEFRPGARRERCTAVQHVCKPLLCLNISPSSPFVT